MRDLGKDPTDYEIKSMMTFADAAYSACNDEDCQEFLKQLVAKSRLPKSGHSAWQRDFQCYVRKDGAELFGKLRKSFAPFHDASPVQCTYKLTVKHCLKVR